MKRTKPQPEILLPENPAERPGGIEPGSRVTVTIEDMAFGGEGVGRVDDFVLFIRFVIPGEVVEAEVTEVRKQFGRARLISVIKASDQRVTPSCRYYGECGGCQYQHVAYEAQLGFKQSQVASLFQRVGGFAPEVVQPVVPCPVPYGYRNRLMVRSQWDKFKKRLNIGFLRAQDRLVVDIEECQIAEPSLNEQIREVRANPPPRGGLKVVVRIAPEDWKVPPDSFFQNNLFLLPKLVETVRQCLVDSGSRYLVDAYCGVGFFAIELAGAVESFVGVEIDRPAIRAARENAGRHGADNGTFELGATEALLPELLQRFPASETSLVLDPPRRGCAPESLALLRRVRPAQIIHVSCHPATLARDVKRLCADGIYQLRRVTPLDMFPQTQHVECVADIRLNPAVAEREPAETVTPAN